MENYVYLLGKCGVLHIPEEWISKYSHYKIVDNISAIEEDEQSYIRLNEEQILFYNLHLNDSLTYLQVFNMELPPIEERIQKISDKRERKYRAITDPLYIAYVKYKEIGETEKAEAKHQEWLEKLQEIKDNNPYPTE